jgi:hypothetical protein
MEDFDRVASHKAVLTEMLVKHGTEWVDWHEIQDYVLIQHNEHHKYIERKDSSVLTHLQFRLTDKALEYLK